MVTVNFLKLFSKNLNKKYFLKSLEKFIVTYVGNFYIFLETGLTWRIIDELAYYSASPIRNLKQNYSWELQYKTRYGMEKKSVN